MRRFTTFAIACLLSPCAIGGVVVVDAANGPGTDWTSLFQAVNVAADGDVILVRAGTYPGFTVDNKSLVIVADTNAAVNVTGSAIVRNLAAGKSVVLRGIDATNTSISGPGLNVFENLGSVWLEDSSFQGTASQVGVQQFSSTFVVAQRVTAIGGDGGSGGFSQPGQGGSGFVNSTVFGPPNVTVSCIWDSTFFGGRGSDGSSDKNGYWGGSCFVAGYGSSMFLDGTVGAAGNGGDQNFSGLFLPLVSGHGGMGLWVNPMPNGPAGQAAYRDISLQPGSAGAANGANSVNGTSGQPIYDIHNQATALTGTTRRFSATSPGRAGQTVGLSFGGQANDVALLLASTTQAQTCAWPNLAAGPLVLPLPLFVLATLPLGPTGQLSFAAPVPQLPPGIDAINLWTQALFLTNSGPQLGGGSAITLLAAGF